MIIDGEYITKDKDGNNINLFMAFDFYVDGGTKITDLPFKSLDGDCRFDRLTSLFNTINLDLEPNNNFRLELKKFYFGNTHEYSDGVYNQIVDLESKLSELTEETELSRIKDQLNVLYEDSDIFKLVNQAYLKEYIYKTDGLIFTPKFKSR